MGSLRVAVAGLWLALAIAAPVEDVLAVVDSAINNVQAPVLEVVKDVLNDIKNEAGDAAAEPKDDVPVSSAATATANLEDVVNNVVNEMKKDSAPSAPSSLGRERSCNDGVGCSEYPDRSTWAASNVVLNSDVALKAQGGKDSDQQGDGSFMDENNTPSSSSSSKLPEETSGPQRAEPPSQEEAQKVGLPSWEQGEGGGGDGKGQDKKGKDKDSDWGLSESQRAEIDKANQMNVETFWHKASNTPGEWDISLSVQLSHNLANDVKRLAGVWKGPITAAILISDKSHIDELNALVKDDNVKKHVDIHLCTASESPKYYPINKMRNQASCNSRTKHVFHMDVDEDPVFEHYKYKELVDTARGDLVRNPNKVVFSVTSYQWMSERGGDVPRQTKDLSKYISDYKAGLKHNYYPRAYTPTTWANDKDAWEGADDYNSWYWKWQGMENAMEIPAGDNYEPYYITPMHECTAGSDSMYDEDYVGWGGNKMIHIRKLMLKKYQFVLLPHVYTFVDELQDHSRKGKGHSMAHEKQKELFSEITSLKSKKLGKELAGCDNCQRWTCIGNCPGCCKAD